MKPLLIGQAPSRSTDGKDPFIGRGGQFIAELIGVDHEALLRDYVEAVNVLDRWPGHNGKGDAFPAGEAKQRAAAMTKEIKGGRLVILAGRAVGQAFGVPASHPYFEPYAMPGKGAVVVIPHPSGVNRWWNEPRNRRLARRCLRLMILGNSWPTK